MSDPDPRTSTMKRSTVAVLSGQAKQLPRPTTTRPIGRVVANGATFLIQRWLPDNIQGFQIGAYNGWRVENHRWNMTPHRARLLMTLCGKAVDETSQIKLRRVLYLAGAAV